MAKRTIHMLVDDLDGGAADETVRFGLDGVQYEIDLSKKNADKMREVFERYVVAGSKVGQAAVVSGPRLRRVVGRGRGISPADRDQSRAIREWARGRGISVSGRGRIRQEVVDRFNAEAGK